MKYYVRRKTCKLKTNYIYHKMYTCFFLNSRPRKPSIYLKEVKNTLASFANVHVSLSTICHKRHAVYHG